MVRIAFSWELRAMFFRLMPSTLLIPTSPLNRAISTPGERNGLRLLCAILAALVCCNSSAFATQSKAATTTSLAVTAGGATVTSVTPKTVVTLTATVQAAGVPVTVGQVNFCDATAAHCTDIHILGTVQLTSAGTATLKFRPGIGSRSYKAAFVGTNINGGSASNTSALAVTGKYPTTTVIAATGNPGDYTLMATVASTDHNSGAAAPSGTVSFLDTSFGDAVVGTAPLGSGTTGLSFLSQEAPALGSGSDVFHMGDHSPLKLMEGDASNAATASPWVFFAVGISNTQSTKYTSVIRNGPPL